jgi:hypothetical protein
MAHHQVSLRSRFWRKVERGEGCWAWTGARRPGRPVFWLDGNTCPAERIAWLLTHGAPPEGQRVVQVCKNERCMRPEHLALSAARRPRAPQLAG